MASDQSLRGTILWVIHRSLQGWGGNYFTLLL